jgi:membrane protease YdiL (CAAX protease family)
VRTQTTPPATLEDSRPSRDRLALALWLVLAGLQIAASFAISGDSTDGGSPIYEYSLGVGSIVLYGILAALTFGIAQLYPSPRDALGLRSFAPRWIGYAALVVVLSLVVGAALEPILHGGEEQGLVPDEWRSDKLAPFLFNAVVIVTVVPFVEELFYRGLGVRALGIFGGAVSVLGSALVFGFAHGILAALPPLAFFGLGLAWVRLKSDSVWPGVIAHASYNGLALLVAALTA